MKAITVTVKDHSNYCHVAYGESASFLQDGIGWEGPYGDTYWNEEFWEDLTNWLRPIT